MGKVVRQSLLGDGLGGNPPPDSELIDNVIILKVQQNWTDRIGFVKKEIGHGLVANGAAGIATTDMARSHGRMTTNRQWQRQVKDSVLNHLPSGRRPLRLKHLWWIFVPTDFERYEDVFSRGQMEQPQTPRTLPENALDTVGA